MPDGPDLADLKTELAELRVVVREMSAGVNNRIEALSTQVGALNDRLYKDNGQPSMQTRLNAVETDQARRRDREKGQRAFNISIALVLLGAIASWVLQHLPWVHK